MISIESLKSNLNFNQEILSLKEWKSVVCVVLVEQNVIFIKRSQSMSTHKGQVAFFGGGVKPGESYLETARRELEEETSLSSLDFNFLGAEPIVYTSRNSAILPIVCEYLGTTMDFISKASSNGEWDYLFSCPVKTLLDNSNWSYATRVGNDKILNILFCYLNKDLLVFSKAGEAGHELLWGASARIIWTLFQQSSNLASNEERE